MRINNLKLRGAITLFLAGAFALAVACGSSDEPTEVPSTNPTTTGSTATAEPVNSDLPAPRSSSGTVTIVMQRVNSHPGINSAQGGEVSVFWGVGETLFTTAPGPVFGESWLAKEWEVADDLSAVTITLQEGVQFHGGFGEMTAEDVAWSLNDANAFTNEESIHAQAGDLANAFGEAEAVDKYTLRLPFTSFDHRWQSNALSDGWQPTGIFSKKAFDDMGRDWMLENTIMTGPFEVRHWLQGDNATLDAVDNHWRKTPEIDTLIYRQIPDNAVRIAQLETGEADAGDISLADIPGLQDKGFLLTGTGNGSELNIAFAGNLWEKTDKDGQPLDRPGLLDKPWIGDPDDPEGMERARKVRHALAMAYDRDELSEVLTAGLGTPNSIGFFNDEAVEFQERWKVDFDVEAAKALLDEAGYSDGFDIEIFGQSNTRIRQETAEAVGAMWAQNLGLNVTVQSFEYSVFRPSIVAREASIPFMNSCDDGRFPRPWDWPVGLVTSSLSRGGFSCALESPFIRDKFLESSAEIDLQKRRAITDEVADYFHNWMLVPSTVTIPVVLVYNPRGIAEWNMRPSLSGPITSPELIVPGNR